MRWATIAQACIALAALALGACNDLREFRGDWRGSRVGDAAELRVNVPDAAAASLSIQRIDNQGLVAELAIDPLVPATPLVSLAGAEADVLADLTFSGAPLRVFLAFVAISDGAGDALVMVALYDDRRIEVRVLRGGASPLYGIFALTASN